MKYRNINSDFVYYYYNGSKLHSITNTRLGLILIYRVYELHPKILVTRFPREPEDIFSRAIYNYACQFSVIRSLLHMFAFAREILEGVLIFGNFL